METQKQPYIEPTLDKCQQLAEVTEGDGPIITGAKPV